MCTGFLRPKNEPKTTVFDQKQGFLSFSVTLGLFFLFFAIFVGFLVLFPLKGHLKAIYLNYENKLEFISLVINQKTHSIFENDFIIVLFWKAYDQKPSK